MNSLPKPHVTHSSATPERLARLQKQFAGHIRDPGSQPAPADVEDRRMAIYRDLFFRNLSGLLAANFPVLRKLHEDDSWDELVRAFFIEHRARTPLFPELPKEFLRYLQDIRSPRESDPPWMLELAHYEWVELALALDPRELDDIPADPAGDPVEEIPVFSPLAWPLSYRFPVHRIGPEFRPERPGAEVTQLLAYRNRADEVRFMKLNDVTQLLLQLLAEHPHHTGRQLLAETASRIGHPDPAGLVAHGRGLFGDLLERDVILGTRPH